MFKNLKARLQQYVNWELPDVQVGLRNGRETRDQIDNICRIIEKARNFKKNIYFCFIDYAKALTIWISTNCWKFLKKQEYHTTLPVSEKPIFGTRSNRTGHGTTDWFKIGKAVHQGYVSHPAYLTSTHSTSSEMLGWMTHARIKIARRNKTASDMQMIPL